jgi:glucokinase
MKPRRPVLALDVGGTKLAAGLLSPAGEVLAEETEATDPAAAPLEIADALLAVGARALSTAGLELDSLGGVGIGFGGPVDYPTQTVVTCHHLAGWEGVPLSRIVQERTGLPAVMDNDANAAALGETVFGAARGCRHVLYVTVSTGIGGGLVLDGRIHRGLNSMAGEIGHTELVPYGPRCTCGRLGCLESVAAGWAIIRDARAALDGGADSALRSLAPEELTAKAVAEMAPRDALAWRIMKRAGEYLGLGIARAANVISPEIVVIGGGISQAGEVILSPVRRAIERSLMPEVGRGLRVAPGALSPRWGLYGAAALAFEELAPRP